MIKLTASDIDGTLVPEGTNELNEDIYEVIRRMQEKGILFAAASGREYASHGITAVCGTCLMRSQKIFTSSPKMVPAC